ncbi:unnamed protein product [Clonostachys rosea]|uniref:Heterokaryon incompatibility domain-containing protein n=1 Tax=Bionectria ochroleuca TaxID=29856 RepID=A0ABY6TY98_BIOOC|nr:unnamed protein product [Clonostachys rosea]
MPTWHKRCKDPDVILVDGVPYCKGCTEFPPVEDVVKVETLDLRLPLEPPPNQLNLRWPSSVAYIDDKPIQHEVSGVSMIAEHAISHANTPATLSATKDVSPYESLAERYIRLLHLSHGEHGDPIHITLVPRKLEFGLEFEALSYTWANAQGDARKTHRVYVGDYWHVVQVTENCANALRKLRRPYYPCILWVDAICIDQDDQTEKEQQVRMMRDIFSSARKVIIYVGDDEPPRDIPDKELADALRKKPYFERVWVIQEIALATTATILWGSKSFDWKNIYPFKDDNSALYLQVFPELHLMIMHVPKSKSLLKTDEIFYIPILGFTILLRPEQTNKRAIAGSLIGIGSLKGASFRRFGEEYESFISSETTKLIGVGLDRWEEFTSYNLVKLKSRQDAEFRAKKKRRRRTELESGPLMLAKLLIGLCPTTDKVYSQEQPWDTFVRIWGRLREARAIDRRQRVQILFHKAILHYYARRIYELALSATTDASMMQFASLGRYIHVFLRSIRLFAWNALRFLQSDYFLRLAGALWDLTMAPWPDSLHSVISNVGIDKISHIWRFLGFLRSNPDVWSELPSLFRSFLVFQMKNAQSNPFQVDPDVWKYFVLGKKGDAISFNDFVWHVLSAISGMDMGERVKRGSKGSIVGRPYFDLDREDPFLGAADHILVQICKTKLEVLDGDIFSDLRQEAVDLNAAILLTGKNRIVAISREKDDRWESLLAREAPQYEDSEKVHNGGWNINADEPIDIEIV